MAHSIVPTNYILISWDMGQSLSMMKVHDKSFYVSRIKADKDNEGLLVFVQGLLENESHPGLIISLYFSNLMPKLCEAINLTGFEVWAD